MKISYNELKQFLKLDWEAEKVAELLTDLGLEVEGIEKYESIKGGLQGVIVGHVLDCTKHPNADKLKCTRVLLGNDIEVPIVCGAPNIAKGQKVPVATVGTILYNAKGEPWEIKKATIRGEESCGMICSEAELGMGQDSSGILVLPDSASPGTPCATFFNIESDSIFEIGLTPNRADAMSHWGVARDLRAGLLQRGVNIPLQTPSVSSFYVTNRTLKIEVALPDPTRCLRYCGITLSGVRISDSPGWLKNRLKAIGITPKNNVVDVTNYILHELGQPLHAFDADKIADKKIVVKTLAKDIPFITLDGATHRLTEEDLMICDAEKPLCIAGIFGGLHSGITANTTSVFLESAYFDPLTVRKTAKRLGLHTDASFRFERGVDIEALPYALMRAALLIKELAGGEITSDIVDVHPKKIEDFPVFLSFENVTKLTGQEIPRETIIRIVTSLDIKIRNSTENGLALNVPSYRVDVRREVDVIEEILRVYGYDKIEASERITTSLPDLSEPGDHKVQGAIGELLIGKGFYEIMTSSLTADYSKLSKMPAEQRIPMLNPLSSDLSELRQSLLFSGLEVMAYNRNRQQENLKLFEFGKTYHRHTDGYQEGKHLALWVTGDKTPKSWNAPAEKADFFYLKGIVMAILGRLGIHSLTTKPAEAAILSEGVALQKEGADLVELGVISQDILQPFELKSEILYADFNWDTLLKIIPYRAAAVKQIPKFPAVRRDLSLLIDAEVTFEAIHQAARSYRDSRLQAIELFDVYEGEHLPQGKKSYAVSVTIQDSTKTLTDGEVDALMGRLQKVLEKQVGAQLRS